MIQWAITLFYIALAIGVTILSWRHPIRSVGIALGIAWAVSVVAALTVDFPQRTIVEVITATMITVGGIDAWTHGQGGRPIRFVWYLSLLDCCFAAALCLFQSSSDTIVSLFDVTTNLIFVGQCLCVAVPGARDVVARWIVRVDHRRALDKAHPDEAWLLRRLDRKDRW